MSREERSKLQFQGYVADTLANNPEWLSAALQAIAAGLERALRDSHEREARMHMAMTLALGLAHPRRLSDGAKELMNSQIVRTLERCNGGTKAEADYLEWANGK